MHKLFIKQLAKATKSSGQVDLNLLGQFVSAALDEADNDRRRTDRSIALMVDELDGLNRDLEKKIIERTNDLVLREAELVSQNQRFDVAINNMSQGLCMFGHDKRLVVCNSQYAKLYGLSPEQVKAGATLRSILEHRVISGNSPADIEKYIQDRLFEVDRGESYQAVNELRDGRVIAVVHRPLPDGGWVALHQDITDQKRAENKISHLAHHDSLTDLPNRALLHIQLNEALSRVRRGESLAVLYLDLDHFKNVNDTLGHPIGDSLLCAVAHRLRECVRDTDIVARLGGDEFAIIQTDMEQPTSASSLAQRLVDSLLTPFNVDHHEIVIGTSVGVSVAPNDGMDADVLLKNADMALYRAKEHGRSGFSFFEPEMDTKMHERRTLETDLRKANIAGEFELFYQPLINLERNSISGFEALLRWNHSNRGMISPASFIPLAEDTGLIIQIGEWVLRQACSEAAKWPDDIKVAVNLSPVQFRNKGLVSMVTSAIATAGIAATRLELEITETAMLQNADQTLAVLHMLQNMGVRISLDDFGTGYSSLSYLRSFPFNKIKIDQSFVRGLGQNCEAIAFIHAISGLGKSLGMTTTVEGVETKEQLEQIRTEGCTEVQGYLFSKPRPAFEVPRLLSSLGKKNRIAA